MRQARVMLGFTVTVVHTDKNRFNASSIEGRMQGRLGGFLLGERLHRAQAAGVHLDPDGRVTDVFITHARIDANSIRYNADRTRILSMCLNGHRVVVVQ